MKKLIYTLAVLFFISMTGQLSAQDIIKQKNGDELEVRIIEQADDYIVYYHINDPNKVEVKMNRSLIREIRYEYGRKETEVAPGLDESYFVDDRKNNIKLNFSSIANNSTILGYERAIDHKSSWEAYLAIHSLGVEQDEYDERSGFGLNAAYKLKFGGLFKKDDYRPAHVLHGTYLRPNIGFNSVDYDMESIDGYDKYSYVHGGLDLGKQWILNNTLSLDIFGGLHYYGGSFTEASTSPNEFNFFNEQIDDGNLTGGGNVAGKYGLQIGFLFN